MHYIVVVMTRILALCLTLLLPAAAHAQAVTTFAAASLTDVMRDLATAWTAQGHPAPVLSFAASSTLARQIEQGAPANLFASADENWMDYLVRRDLIAADTRRDLLTNQLVLVVPASSPRKVDIKPGFDLVGLLGSGGRLAVGDPAHVPAGLYAKQALTRLGLWDMAQPRLASAEDVRGALLLVQRGEAPAGIVYATDAASTPGVAVAGVFPESSHDPVVYPFAVTKAGDTPDARAFLTFLSGPAAREVFAKRGFAVE